MRCMPWFPPAVAIMAFVSVVAGAWASELSLSRPEFNGKIAKSAEDSVPDWPQPVKAPGKAPNIVVILLDDVGFADTSTFGGIAHTPELDKLAAEGLRYNNFHTTAMCSPTRAALLTGRNHHRVGFGIIADYAAGYPGYNSVWKQSTASIAAVLKLNGYNTAAFGKWHNTPDWEISPIGPFDRWPTGLGFEYFYGFMGPRGDENHWEPTKLYRNTTPIDPHATPERGYHLTTDITNQAITWIRTHESLAPEKPYFLYFATGAVHGPHHVPKEWIDPYRGKFDHGWDRLREEIFARQKKLGVIPLDTQLTPRLREVPAWDSLSADQRKLYARQMEVYAGFIAHTDAEIGRLLEAIRSSPDGEDTLVVYIVGDNGADGGAMDLSPEMLQEQLRRIDELGSAKIPDNYYARGWAWAGNTPFQWWKAVASHFGGVRNPLIVSWPARITDKGGLRTQFTHVNDVAATIYDLIGIVLPSEVNGSEQQPLDGVSFAQTFSTANAPSSHRTQYFELLGSRAIYQDGWVAAARHPFSSQANFAMDRWELYHVAEDFSESRDLAGTYPDKLKALQELFDVEARKNDVYPLGAVFNPGMKPSLTSAKREFIYYSGTQRIPDALLPDLAQSSYRMTADILIPEAGAEGVIASYGNRKYGFVWYIKDGHVVYENRVGERHQILTSRMSLSRGRTSLAFAFERSVADRSKEDSKWWEGKWWEGISGTARLYIDGQLAAEAALSQFFEAQDAAMFIGRAAGPPVSTSFSQPFAFTGTLEKVTVEMQ